MPKNPNNFNPFTFMDRDPQAVGDQMAREMSREEAALAIQRAEVWMRDVREWESARRWRREKDEDETNEQLSVDHRVVNIVRRGPMPPRKVEEENHD